MFPYYKMPFEILEQHLYKGKGHIKENIVEEINASGETELRICDKDIKTLPLFYNIEKLTLLDCDLILEIPVSRIFTSERYL